MKMMLVAMVEEMMMILTTSIINFNQSYASMTPAWTLTVLLSVHIITSAWIRNIPRSRKVMMTFPISLTSTCSRRAEDAIRNTASTRPKSFTRTGQWARDLLPFPQKTFGRALKSVLLARTSWILVKTMLVQGCVHFGKRVFNYKFFSKQTCSVQPSAGSIPPSPPTKLTPSSVPARSATYSNQPNRTAFGARRLEQIHKSQQFMAIKSSNVTTDDEQIYEEIDLTRIGTKLPPPPLPVDANKLISSAGKINSQCLVPNTKPMATGRNEVKTISIELSGSVCPSDNEKNKFILNGFVSQKNDLLGNSTQANKSLQRACPIKSTNGEKLKESLPIQKETSIIDAVRKRRNMVPTPAKTSNNRNISNPAKDLQDNGHPPVLLSTVKQQNSSNISSNNNNVGSGMSSNSSSCSSGIGISSSLVPSPSSASSSNATSSESHSSSSTRSRFNKSPKSSSKASFPPELPETPPPTKVSARHQGLRYKYQTECWLTDDDSSVVDDEFWFFYFLFIMLVDLLQLTSVVAFVLFLKPVVKWRRSELLTIIM